MSLMRDYMKGLRVCLDEVVLQEKNIERIADIIFRAYKNGKQVFVIGNGGSASTASHCALGFEKQSAIEGKPRIRSKSLTDNVALITALANDINYTSIFKEQLVNQLDDGDVLVAISASGNSPNIIQAAEYAKGRGAIIVGFIGFGGGKLKELADESVCLISKNYGQVEDTHLALTHILSDILKERIASD
jgi:D-sedoheptulose 7-phosphate isomerase